MKGSIQFWLIVSSIWSILFWYIFFTYAVVDFYGGSENIFEGSDLKFLIVVFGFGGTLFKLAGHTRTSALTKEEFTVVDAFIIGSLAGLIWWACTRIHRIVKNFNNWLDDNFDITKIRLRKRKEDELYAKAGRAFARGQDERGYEYLIEIEENRRKP